MSLTLRVQKVYCIDAWQDLLIFRSQVGAKRQGAGVGALAGADGPESRTGTPRTGP